jgi:molybdopterin molybdotransferase
MISIQEAFSILENAISPLKHVEIPLFAAQNHVLAETLHSPIDMPPFRQSNMDGYAIALHDALVYTVIGEIKAGDEHQVTLEPGEAVKIFTGAAVPDPAEAVIQIEKVNLSNNTIVLNETVMAETNVRQQGSQISKGAVALEKGAMLNAAAIGFLAGLGFVSVKVYQKPLIGIVITGNELVQPGQILPYGKVYESNWVMLHVALKTAGFVDVKRYETQDNFESTQITLKIAIEENDVVVVSGGISVGDYDFTGKALQSLNVETLFHKVNQKPGKPLWAGKSGDKLIFALPGNPAAALTCYYIDVLPTLKKLSGMDALYLPTIQRTLSHDYSVSNSRDLLLKAAITDQNVTILQHQDSSMLDSFALANALAYLPNGNYDLAKGTSVFIYPIK